MAKAGDRVKEVKDALPVTLGLRPDQETEGWIFAPRHEDGWPFALVFQWNASAPPAYIPLLTAVSRAEKQE